MTIVRIWIVVSLVALATSQNTGFSPAVPTPNVDGDWLVWTAGRYTPFTPLLTESVINNASLDSTFFSDVTEVRSNVIHRGGIGTQYWSIATNHRRGLYYYLDLLSNNIGIYDVTNGTSSRHMEGISWSADGVAVDWLTGNTYVINTHLGVLVVANEGFTHVRNLHTALVGVSGKIVVDPIRRHLYWTFQGGGFVKIYKSNLLGESPSELHHFNNSSIHDVTIDFVENRLYFIERHHPSNFELGTTLVRYFNLNYYQDVTTVLTTHNGLYGSVVSYRDTLILHDRIHRSLRIFNKTSLAVTSRRFGGLTSPRGLVLSSVYNQPDNVHKPCRGNPCSDICIPINNNIYHCLCDNGRVALSNTECGYDVIDDNFIITLDGSQRKIYQAPIDDGARFREIPAPTPGTPTAVGFDRYTRKLYWADIQTNSIFRMNMDGSGKERVVEAKTYSIEIDDVSKTLYYVDETLDAIVVTSLEENARKHTLAVNDIHDVHKMTMSLSRRKIYWSDKGQHRRGVRVGRIEHMDLAGGGREVLVDNINSPHSLAISEPDNTLFWTSHVTIGWKNLNNGNQGQYKLPNSVNSIIDISCYSQHMFIARLNEPSLKTILISDVINNVTHDNLNVFGKSLFYKVTALMLFVNKSLNTDPTDCSVNNGGCPHICLPGTSRPHCVCADHYDIIPANNTCVMRHNATGDITPPDFGSSCPSEYFLVYLDECSNTGSFNISTPQANDDSGSVVVRAGQTHPPPYRLTLGFHRFSYKAQDLSGNTAYCQFYVTVLEQRCYRPPHIPTHGSPSPPSCGSQYGSVINVTCAGSNHTTFQIRCAFTGRWVATGAAECPPFIPPPTTTTEPTPRLQTTTTTTPTNAQTTNIATTTSQTTTQTTPPPIAGTNNGGPTPTTTQLTNQPTQDSANQARGIPGPEKLQDGFIVLIVLVIVVVIIVALLLVRRYMKVSWPLREAKFRSSDESVMLANEDML